MSLKITTLIENNPGENSVLAAEHGLSFYVEKDGRSLLFDTGQTGAFLDNADRLHIDMTKTEYVVLSHGHYDHSGGLHRLIEKTTAFTLFIGENFFSEKYIEKDGTYRFIGNNFDQDFLENRQIRYQIIHQDCTEILPDIFIITNFPRLNKDEVINPCFRIMQDQDLLPDDFNDEILLAIDTSQGLIILLGCAHPGVRNMLNHVKNILKRPLYAVLGGTHLVDASPECLEASLDYLRKSELKILGASHCTGTAAMKKLAESNNHYYHNRTGSVLLIEEQSDQASG